MAPSAAQITQLSELQYGIQVIQQGSCRTEHTSNVQNLFCNPGSRTDDVLHGLSRRLTGEIVPSSESFAKGCTSCEIIERRWPVHSSGRPLYHVVQVQYSKLLPSTAITSRVQHVPAAPGLVSIYGVINVGNDIFKLGRCISCLSPALWLHFVLLLGGL